VTTTTMFLIVLVCRLSTLWRIMQTHCVRHTHTKKVASSHISLAAVLTIPMTDATTTDQIHVDSTVFKSCDQCDDEKRRILRCCQKMNEGEAKPTSDSDVNFHRYLAYYHHLVSIIYLYALLPSEANVSHN
jgi:hypothetical protein